MAGDIRYETRSRKAGDTVAQVGLLLPDLTGPLNTLGYTFGIFEYFYPMLKGSSPKFPRYLADFLLRGRPLRPPAK